MGLIDVRYEEFVKQYFIDLLVDGGAPFELKTVKALSTEHRTLNASDRFEDHLRRFLSHTTLHGIHWVNIRRDVVTFHTLQK